MLFVNVLLYNECIMKKKISIIGSTGSIGTQSLEVIEKLQDKFEIIALAGGSNVNLLNKQIEKFKPKYVCLGKPNSALNAQNAKVFYGDEGLDEICSNKENDIILVAVSGKIGLKPTLSAIANGIDIALANKETLVMAGDIVMKKSKEAGVKILPVDSEHSAIFQCIDSHRDKVDRLVITASGGPFLHKSIDEIKKATVEQALAHPRWNMGKKITVDSATLMNKGLEIIEAHHLFDMNYDNIKVVVHPQSYIHSAVEFNDGSVIAQIGVPSMHIPIQYAICYPERPQGIKTRSFDFVQAQKFEFLEPDFEKFPCMKLAYEAGMTGGSATTCLNAANEEAVYAFLDGKITLYDIYTTVEKIYRKHNVVQNPNIDEIFEIDKAIREQTKALFV